MDGFWADLWRSFKAVYGPVLTGVAVVLAIGAFFYFPGAVLTVGWKWLAPAGTFLVILACVFVDMLAVARRLAQSQDRPPRLIAATTSSLEDGSVNAPIILVLDPAPLFGIDMLVSIYRSELLTDVQERGFERFIGVGRVLNIQANGLVQVLVLAEFSGQTDVWRRIRSREMQVLKDVLVRSSVSREGLALVRSLDTL